MRNIVPLLLAASLLAFSSCEKSSPVPSIIGTWSMTGISGTVVRNGNPGDSSKETLSYNNNVLTQIDVFSNTANADTNTYLFSTESWTFNRDGTYLINEVYTDSSGLPMNHSSINTGTWIFQSNTTADNGIVLNGTPYFLIQHIMESDAYVIQSVTNSTLVISYNNVTENSLLYINS